MAQKLAPSLARHDHKLMIKRARVHHDFYFLFFFSSVGSPTEKYARMDVWHYHLEATENSEEDLPEEYGGLS